MDEQSTLSPGWKSSISLADDFLSSLGQSEKLKHFLYALCPSVARSKKEIHFEKYKIYLKLIKMSYAKRQKLAHDAQNSKLNLAVVKWDSEHLGCEVGWPDFVQIQPEPLHEGTVTTCQLSTKKKRKTNAIAKVVTKPSVEHNRKQIWT